ncbi:SRPBCC family protein [Streptomyces sp. NPDC051162]|uniref:SRPBCC family protein n=1 Tax=unclassified Streptomyces TaxID=2593676 RepID=UPI00342BD887
MPLPSALIAPNRYRFRATWTFAVAPDVLYACLEIPESYPSWWPQVREATRTGADTGTLRVRSFLPYELAFAVHGASRDPVARTLEIAMTGDLEGWARWTVLPYGRAGSQARFEQDVEVRKPLMRRLAIPARPLFVANHAWMMRAGRRGLRTRLEAGADRI